MFDMVLNTPLYVLNRHYLYSTYANLNSVRVVLHSKDQVRYTQEPLKNYLVMHDQLQAKKEECLLIADWFRQVMFFEN